MTQREKLAWMLRLLMNPKNAFVPTTAADFLLANGVVIPCRCGECRYYGTDGKCEVHDDYAMYETDFCSYAKRKGGDE